MNICILILPEFSTMKDYLLPIMDTIALPNRNFIYRNFNFTNLIYLFLIVILLVLIHILNFLFLILLYSLFFIQATLNS
jgi:hypothetical protein